MCFFDDDGFWNNERRRREIFLDREFSLEFLHKKERDVVYIKDELFFF